MSLRNVRHLLLLGLRSKTVIAIVVGVVDGINLRVFILQSNFIQNSEIFQEIVFISVESKNFKNANHFVVTVLNQAVEEWDC